MNKQARIKTVFLYVVFICYMLLLIKILFLSRISDLEHRSINLIPFHSIKEYIFSSFATIKKFAFGNVVGNIVIFIPFGTYLSLFKNDKIVRTNLSKEASEILGLIKLMEIGKNKSVKTKVKK